MNKYRRLIAATAIAALPLIPTPTEAAPQAALSCFMWTSGSSFSLRCYSGAKVYVYGTAQCWTQNSRTVPGHYVRTARTVPTYPGGKTVTGICVNGLTPRYLRWYRA